MPWGFSGGSVAKNLPTVQEPYETMMVKIWIRKILDQKHPLEVGMATHSSFHAWRIPMYRGVHGVANSQMWLKQLSIHAYTTQCHNPLQQAKITGGVLSWSYFNIDRYFGFTSVLLTYSQNSKYMRFFSGDLKV